MASIEKGRTIRAMFHSSSKWVECIFYKALSLFSKIINKKFDIWNVNSLYFHFRLRKMTDKRQPGYISNGFEVTLSPLSHSLTPSFSLNLPFLLCLSPSPLSPSPLSPSLCLCLSYPLFFTLTNSLLLTSSLSLSLIIGSICSIFFRCTIIFLCFLRRLIKRELATEEYFCSLKKGS